MRAPAGITVIRDVLSQTGISFTVVGKVGDALSVGVPNSVNVVSGSGQSLTLNTTQQVQFAGATILAEDAVSVSVGAEFSGHGAEEAPAQYEGVMVVLAQYN